jgi:hypothetical protein
MSNSEKNRFVIETLMGSFWRFSNFITGFLEFSNLASQKQASKGRAPDEKIQKVSEST